MSRTVSLFIQKEGRMDMESQRKARLLALEEKRSKLDELRKQREDRNNNAASTAVSISSLKTLSSAVEEEKEGIKVFFLCSFL